MGVMKLPWPFRGWVFDYPEFKRIGLVPDPRPPKAPPPPPPVRPQYDVLDARRPAWISRELWGDMLLGDRLFSIELAAEGVRMVERIDREIMGEPSPPRSFYENLDRIIELLDNSNDLQALAINIRELAQPLSWEPPIGEQH